MGLRKENCPAKCLEGSSHILPSLDISTSNESSSLSLVTILYLCPAACLLGVQSIMLLCPPTPEPLGILKVHRSIFRYDIMMTQYQCWTDYILLQIVYPFCNIFFPQRY